VGDRLAGKIAFITGAASGIGAATAGLFAREGAHVVLADVNKADAERHAAGFRGKGGSAEALQVDVSDPSAFGEALEAVALEHGRLDILVCCAFRMVAGSLETLSPEAWQRCMEVTLHGTFFGVRSALGIMKRQGGGAIVCFSSLCGQRGQASMGGYGAAKAGVENLTRTAAVEAAPHRVRVNAVAPGNAQRLPRREPGTSRDGGDDAGGAAARADRDRARRAVSGVGRGVGGQWPGAQRGRRTELGARNPGARRGMGPLMGELRTIGHWIGGKPAPGSSGRSGPVYDPARGVEAARVALASAEEVAAVVALASEAAIRWRATPLGTRASALFRLRELVDVSRDRLAAAVTAEHGKVLSDAAGEVDRGLENIEFACGIPNLLKGAHSTQVSQGVDVHTVRAPLGVVAGITPFNFPVMVPLWMLANALACGNAFILKPSEKDPSASLILAELIGAAGFPEGVFNVVHGDREAVDALLTHADVAAVSFVGSTPVARHVYETGTRHGKRVQALGGAKNHMVVLPDADLEAAADAAVSAAYGSAGERCMAISVVVAVGGVADALVDAIAARIPSIVIGPGDDPASQMGPLISAEHRDRVRSYVQGAQAEGARVVVDGSMDAAPHGFFLGCSLIDDVQPGMKLYDDEIFGPVLSVVRAATYEEALALVNRSPYGNGVALFTRDGGAARRFELAVEAGMVGINVPIPVPVGYHSFGGWKASLFGDSAMYGPEGVRFYTRPKVVTSRWPDPATSRIDLGFPTTR
jgi:malonate-semialdehyde dehydrogenase (acetylating)/methylmalonate-semialdehyde dehydrogenase